MTTTEVYSCMQYVIIFKCTVPWVRYCHTLKQLIRHTHYIEVLLPVPKKLAIKASWSFFCTAIMKISFHKGCLFYCKGRRGKESSALKLSPFFQQIRWEKSTHRNSSCIWLQVRCSICHKKKTNFQQYKNVNTHLWTLQIPRQIWESNAAWIDSLLGTF